MKTVKNLIKILLLSIFTMYIIVPAITPKVCQAEKLTAKERAAIRKYEKSLASGQDLGNGAVCGTATSFNCNDKDGNGTTVTNSGDCNKCSPKASCVGCCAAFVANATRRNNCITYTCGA